MEEAGFPVGRGLYDSIAEFSCGGETIYNTRLRTTAAAKGSPAPQTLQSAGSKGRT